jgi:2-hydroxy-6-oxonona-2,4-dienedioate hydrolase
MKETDMIAPTHTRFRWLERGEGEPVLLLHGLMGEMDHWESTLGALGPFRRPIALELPIFDPDLPDVSVPALADYVRHFMEAIELPPAIVCGNSLGGHEDRLSQIRVPTLLVWGKDDRITPTDVAERFHARIGGSQLVYLPNCGHAPMLERPEAFHAAVGDWLVETRARRAILGGRA